MAPVKYHMGKFPPEKLNLEMLLPLVGKASMALGRYDGLLAAIPNTSVLLSPLTTQEAVLSSKIEGTNITIGEIFEIDAGVAREGITQPARDDAEEIINYRRALQECAREISDRPLSQYTIRQAHTILMQGVRGKDKTPGAYRFEQNWIGSKGCSIDKASFVPIAPEHLLSGMDAWSKYLNDQSGIEPLIQLAITHVEFEALHPFKDGNGRLGRMLIPLFLYSRKLLSNPSFYMSGYLERNREEYIDRLRAVSSHGMWSEWCAFFIVGVAEQAIDNERKAREILRLYNTIKTTVVDITHSQHALRAVDFLFQFPYFYTPAFISYSKIPKPTASRIVSLLWKNDVIKVLSAGKGRSPSLFCFPALVNIAEGKEVF